MNEGETDLVLTNIIQADAASSASPNMPTFPPQSPGKGPNDFASSLRSAERIGPPVPARSQAEPPTAAGRGKSTQKDPVKSWKTTSLQVKPAIDPTSLEEAKPISVLAAHVETMPALPADITSSVAARGSIPPAAVTSRSNPTSGLPAGGDSAKQWASVGFSSQVQKNASTHDPATAFDSGLSVAALDAGKQTPPGAAPPPNVEAFGEARVWLNKGEAGTHAAVANGVVEADVARPGSVGTLPLDSADLAALARTSSPSGAEFAGIVVNGGPRLLGATAPTGTPHAVDPTSGTENAVTGVKQSASDSKSQSGDGSGLESPAALAPSFTASSMAPSTASSMAPFTASSKASFTASGTASSAEISRPISLRAAMAPKAVETISAADTRAKESPAAPVPSNQEGTRSKPADSSSNPADAKAQPLSPGSVPASPSGQANGGDQPGSAVATGNVLAQVSPAANQDSGSRSAPLPAAAPQSPAASSPTSMPAVGTVEVARLVAGASQSEMHIGLRTQAFGSVEVHTVVRDSQVGLTVGSERGDLRTLLANEVSGLQTTFRQQDLRFDNVRFLETSAGTTAGFSGGADSQARSSSQEHSSTAGLFSIHSPPEDPAELDISDGLRTRLNVHA